MELFVYMLILLYILYWAVSSIIIKSFYEVFLAVAVGILTTQIFLVANYSGQFLRLNLDRDLNVSLQYAGLLLILSSVFLLGWSFLSKRKMTNLVSLFGNTQVFMTQGIYGVIRHPVHLSGIIATLGIALLMLNNAIIALSIIASTAFFIASKEEDKHGLESLGEEYDIYMESVPSFNLISGISKVIQKRSA